MKICGIYKITSPSKKVYIGQSIDILRRWGRYRNLSCKSQERIKRSLEKYGVDKHKFEVVCQCDRLELDNLEKYYIELYQCFNSEYGLNLRSGGTGGGVYSDETRKRLSESHKGKISAMKGRHHSEATKKLWRDQRTGRKVTAETKAKMSAKSKGHRRHTAEQLQMISDMNKGKHLSDEVKSKISLKKKGKKLTDKHKKNVIAAIKKRWENPEYREKMKLAFKHKIISKETRLKMAESRKKNHKGHSQETKDKISKTLLSKNNYASDGTMIIDVNKAI